MLLFLVETGTRLCSAALFSHVGHLNVRKMRKNSRGVTGRENHWRNE
jgi:hypothetical protein